MIIHQDPFIAIIDGIIPSSIIEEMKIISNNDFHQSLGTQPDGSSMLSPIRTSSTYHTKDQFKPATDIVLNVLARQYNHIYDATLAETWQLTQYEPGQFYKSHYDYFHNEKQLKGRPNRRGTVILYLNDDFIGGETGFSKLGLKVTPRQGACLYFAYPVDNPTKELTFHAGESVIHGIKRIATLWLR
jgi:hypothetical protein